MMKTKAAKTLTLIHLSLCLTQSLLAQPYQPDFCTFMGGSKWERVQSVCVDNTGHIYIAGSTKSPDFPVTPGAYDTTTGGNNGQNDGYVAKLAPDGSRIVWSTYLHGTSRDDIYGIRVLENGDIYLVGWTRSSNFPTTPGAYDRTHNGNMDVFLARLSPDGKRLEYSTFLGGSGKDRIRDLARTPCGRLVFAGDTYSENLPVTENAPQPSLKPNGDTYIAAFDPQNLLPGDINADKTVNYEDLEMLIATWLIPHIVCTDTNHDNITNMQDFSTIAHHWLTNY